MPPNPINVKSKKAEASILLDKICDAHEEVTSAWHDVEIAFRAMQVESENSHNAFDLAERAQIGAVKVSGPDGSPLEIAWGEVLDQIERSRPPIVRMAEATAAYDKALDEAQQLAQKLKDLTRPHMKAEPARGEGGPNEQKRDIEQAKTQDSSGAGAEAEAGTGV